MPITTPTKQLLVKLNKDKLSDIILNDPVNIRCTEKLATKAPNVATASRNTLREPARLVQMMRQLLNTNDFGPLSVIDPTLDPKTEQCIQQLSQNSPSYGLRIDHTSWRLRRWLKQTVIFTLIGKKNGVKARKFQKVLNLFWTIDVSSKARRVLYAKQLNNKTPLPTSKDIILNNFHKKNLQQKIVHLKAHPTTEDYSNLEKVVLCLLCVFNRKRKRETSRIPAADYRNCKMGMSGNIDEYDLPSFEKFEILPNFIL